MIELTYEHLNQSFAIDMASIWADPDVIYYTNIKAPCSADETQARICRLESMEIYIVQRSRKTIGIIGCPCLDTSANSFGLFYQFRKDSWGNGYATQAVQWMLQLMKNKYPGCKIFADVVESNQASVKILRHFGFQLIAKEKTFIRGGVKMSILNYMLDFPY